MIPETAVTSRARRTLWQARRARDQCSGPGCSTVRPGTVQWARVQYSVAKAKVQYSVAKARYSTVWLRLGYSTVG